MFGIGGSEILVILVIALLFLGPDKLPDAAKTISKGIRDLKKQSRALQNQIESDEQIGGAIRDLKSALRGEDPPARPPVRKEPPKLESVEPEAAEPALPPPDVAGQLAAGEANGAEEPKQHVTLPELAGEPDPDVKTETDDGELAAMIKPAPGIVAKGEPEKHG
ncbi:MAG: twin-arginine translocase TatA/TatE family subunit [Kofleriaceae bacterium]|nr:twin-arginine translocase TatA/TatE family subunit [Kofleriaceae bacterium]